MITFDIGLDVTTFDVMELNQPRKICCPLLPFGTPSSLIVQLLPITSRFTPFDSLHDVDAILY